MKIIVGWENMGPDGPPAQVSVSRRYAHIYFNESLREIKSLRAAGNAVELAKIAKECWEEQCRSEADQLAFRELIDASIECTINGVPGQN